VDEGTYTLAEGDDPVVEIGKGKIKFILRGKKLHGMFTLVKIKSKGGESATRGCLSRITISSSIRTTT